MKNKAFTLTELVSVIIIMGLVLLFLIPSVQRMINSNKEDKYVTYVGKVEMAVKGYADIEYGENTGEVSVNIKTLLDKKYLGAIPDVDADKKTVIENSIITFSKVNNKVIITNPIKITFTKGGKSYSCDSKGCN